MQFDRAHPNALPIGYAIGLAKHFDVNLDLGILQANVVSHTAADAETRILGQPVYMGKLERGTRVLIVDDVITFGSTLANLRGWIEKQGATVVGATTWNSSRFRPKNWQTNWDLQRTVSLTVNRDFSAA